jgi:hypothetical protein
MHRAKPRIKYNSKNSLRSLFAPINLIENKTNFLNGLTPIFQVGPGTESLFAKKH